MKTHHPQERIAERIVAQIVQSSSSSDSGVSVQNGTEHHAEVIPVPSIRSGFENLGPNRERPCSAHRRGGYRSTHVLKPRPDLVAKCSAYSVVASIDRGTTRRSI